MFMNKASESELRIELVRLIRLQPKKKEEYPIPTTQREEERRNWRLGY
jgi:hypothetical protein